MSQNPPSFPSQTYLASGPSEPALPSEAFVELVASDAREMGMAAEGEVEPGTRRLSRLLTGQTAREQRGPTA